MSFTCELDANGCVECACGHCIHEHDKQRWYQLCKLCTPKAYIGDYPNEFVPLKGADTGRSMSISNPYKSELSKHYPGPSFTENELKPYIRKAIHASRELAILNEELVEVIKTIEAKLTYLDYPLPIPDEYLYRPRLVGGKYVFIKIKNGERVTQLPADEMVEFLKRLHEKLESSC